MFLASAKLAAVPPVSTHSCKSSIISVFLLSLILIPLHKKKANNRQKKNTDPAVSFLGY
jgi:hypothetical protein